MRKGFNFYRSYYEVANRLPEKDRGAFLWALVQRQFEGKEPQLKGMASFAYLSQKHSIDSQVTGFETKTGKRLHPSEGGYEGPIGGATEGGGKGASVQEKGKGKEEGKEKGEVKSARPSEEEFLSYCQGELSAEYADYEFSLKKKFRAWVENGWKDGNEKPIKNWKSKILNTIPYLEKEKNSAKKENGKFTSFTDKLANW